jgi:hypothetical protein
MVAMLAGCLRWLSGCLFKLSASVYAAWKPGYVGWLGCPCLLAVLIMLPGSDGYDDFL